MSIILMNENLERLDISTLQPTRLGIEPATSRIWELCGKNDLYHEAKWYEHEPESVTENDNCKILQNSTIQTDHVIQARRLDIVVIKK